MKEIVLENQYYRYTLLLDDEGRLFHGCFLPSGVEPPDPEELAKRAPLPLEAIVGVDDDAGEEQEPPLTGRWTATSSYAIYMVDTPKETNGDEATEDNPLGKKAKHGRRRRRYKPRHSNTSTGDKNNPDGAEDKYNPD